MFDRLIDAGARHLPFGVAIGLAKRLLAAQGFGCGANVGSSGELGVFQYVRSRQPLLFDVGAHTGEYTRSWLNHFPSGRACLFEPSREHFDLLAEGLRDDASVVLFPVGLSDQPGQQSLYKDQAVSGLASLTQRRLGHFGISLDLVETVTLRTLDSVVEQQSIHTIDLLKLDVEGHELAVLRGAASAMERKVIRLVQFEFGGSNLDTRTNLQDFFYFFDGYGFELGVVHPSRKVVKLNSYDEFFEHYRTTNYIAAPRGTLGR